MGREYMTDAEKEFDARYGDEWRKKEEISGRQALSYYALIAFMGPELVLRKVAGLVRKGVLKVLN